LTVDAMFLLCVALIAFKVPEDAIFLQNRAKVTN